MDSCDSEENLFATLSEDLQKLRRERRNLSASAFCCTVADSLDLLRKYPDAHRRCVLVCTRDHSHL